MAPNVPFLLLTACKAFANHRAGLVLIKIVYSVGLGPRRRQDCDGSEDKGLLDHNSMLFKISEYTRNVYANSWLTF